MPIDLDAYLRRIGYSGPREPTLSTLQAIHRLHAQTIAFENLDPLIRRPIALDPASLERKLVRGGRGGYCFEHNLLLRQVLTRLGFRVTGLAARVRWNAPPENVTARGHMLLLVDLPGGVNDGPHIADVGFGGLTLTGPLRLDTEAAQPTPHEPFRLRRIEADGEPRTFMLEAQVRGEWHPLYQFDLHPQLQPDYEITSWYLSNHPASHFVTGLIAARPDGDRRYALRNTELAIHHLDGTTERERLSTAADLRRALEGHFRLTLPDRSLLDPALERIVANAAAAAPAGRRP
jgi:N-hydroxyarylamine O-acetyltransferase